MSVVLKLKNQSELFNEVKNKIIINDLNITDMKDLKEELFVKYSNELSLIPQCKCGRLKGNYLKNEYCEACSTYVEDRFNELKPFIWVYKLRDDLPFLSPYIWGTINLLMGKDDSLRWLADTTYNPPSVQSYLHTIASLIGGRGYLNVINNLDKILEFIKGYSKFKKPEKQLHIDELLKRIKSEKQNMFTDYLPLFNNNFFVVEKNNKDTYTSSVLGDIIDIAMMVITTVNNYKVTPKRQEITTAKIIAKISNLFQKYVKDNLAGKKKLVRKHIYGTRAHFTGRAVITAIAGKHEYDDLHLPWKVAIPLFRPHILNVLMKKGYTYRDASDKIFAASTTFDEEIYEIFNHFIQSHPSGGIPALFHRNPTLLQGSMQLFKITKIKRDMNDRTISLSILVVKAPNADFDGFEENVA